MGQAMKTKAESMWEVVTSKLARLYVTRWKGLDVSLELAIMIDWR